MKKRSGAISKLFINLALKEISDILKVFLIIAVILSAVLILLEHTVKFALYIFGIFLAGILIVSLLKTDYKFKINIPRIIKFFDYFFIVSSVFLFITILALNPNNEVTFYFSLVVSFFLPGWVLLRVLGVVENHKTTPGILAVISLSFTCSLGITAILFLLGIVFRTDVALLQSGIFLLASLIPLAKDFFRRLNDTGQVNSLQKSNEHSLFDILILAWIIVFFIFAISSLYPLMADNPFIDISRIFSQSEKTLLNPQTFASYYPWHNFNVSTIQNFSSSPYWLFHTGTAYLSIILIFSFYILSKAYLSDIDKRAHRLATVFFFVFSGFGWIF